MPRITIRADVEFDLADISQDDLEEEVRRRSGRDLSAWIKQAYRLIAEGDMDAALELMHAEADGLPPPSHEKKLVERLRRKEPAHV
jgi:hypothetical protein